MPSRWRMWWRAAKQVRRQRPPLSLLVCTIAPLAQDRDGLESALLFAQAGLPVGFMSMVNTGSTAPATIAGTLVTGDAEIISALVLIQMAHPGAHVYFTPLMPGIMHPRTGDYQSSTLEGSLLYPLGAEMAHHWGVPTLAGIFGTDAQVPGWQSAAEAESSLLLCALVGAETGSGLGLGRSRACCCTRSQCCWMPMFIIACAMKLADWTPARRPSLCR